MTGSRVLITGGAGLVGGHLIRSAPAGIETHATWLHTPPDPAAGSEVVLSGLHRIDLRGPDEVDSLIAEVGPDVVVHTAYRQDSREDVVDVSALVAAAVARVGGTLVHLSSDVVFSGDDPPYDESVAAAPVSDYGRWKLEAERAVLGSVPDACITRTSLVVSSDPPDAGTRWLLGEVARGSEPTLFIDEMRTPILAEDLAFALWRLVAMPRAARAGVWHLPGPEVLSRYELGARILLREGLDPGSVRGASAASHPEPRPRDLTLLTDRRIPGFEPRQVG